MRKVARLPEPVHLTKNEAKWLNEFLRKRGINPQTRPSNKQYGHKTIVEVLWQMGHGKCFYCECFLDEQINLLEEDDSNLKDTRPEVDHYIEVVNAPNQAFAWTNLYLSCRQCNRCKQPHHKIPVTECVNPCDPQDDPLEHLTFKRQIILAKNDSSKGDKTIEKYNLNRENLKYRRLKRLHEITDRVRKILALIDEGKNLTQEDKRQLAQLCESDQIFSLMLLVYFAPLINL